MTTIQSIVKLSRISPADLQELTALENAFASDPLSEKQIVRLFCIGRFYGVAARIDEVIVGYVICEVTESKQIIKRLILSRDHRHLGIAQELLWCVSHEQSQKTVIEVPESNVETQCFLRSAGYRAVKTIKNRSTLVGGRIEDAYVFQKK